MTPVNSARKMPEAFNQIWLVHTSPFGSKTWFPSWMGLQKTSPEEELMAYHDFFPKPFSLVMIHMEDIHMQTNKILFEGFLENVYTG